MQRPIYIQTHKTGRQVTIHIHTNNTIQQTIFEFNPRKSEFFFPVTQSKSSLSREKLVVPEPNFLLCFPLSYSPVTEANFGNSVSISQLLTFFLQVKWYLPTYLLVLFPSSSSANSKTGNKILINFYFKNSSWLFTFFLRVGWHLSTYLRLNS